MLGHALYSHAEYVKFLIAALLSSVSVLMQGPTSHVMMEMFDWLGVSLLTRDVWRSATTERGGPSVTMGGVLTMRPCCVDSSATQMKVGVPEGGAWHGCRGGATIGGAC